jgi:hypothetical protein
MNILIISLTALLINIPLGIWRRKYKKFSFMWFFLIHASIPLIIPLRLWLDTPNIFIPLFIGMAVAGQFIVAKNKNNKCH